MGDDLKKFVLYTAPSGEIRVDVLLQNETVWFSQKAMSLLFDCSTDNVSLHLKNIFESNELEENSVTEVFSATASDRTHRNELF
nr:death-on-curing protein [Flavobacterium sp.]